MMWNFIIKQKNDSKIIKPMKDEYKFMLKTATFKIPQ